MEKIDLGKSVEEIKERLQEASGRRKDESKLDQLARAVGLEEGQPNPSGTGSDENQNSSQD